MHGCLGSLTLVGRACSCHAVQHDAARRHRIPRSRGRERGRIGWQRAAGHGMRSHVETTMGRHKRLTGPKLRARSRSAQLGEAAGISRAGKNDGKISFGGWREDLAAAGIEITDFIGEAFEGGGRRQDDPAGAGGGRLPGPGPAWRSVRGVRHRHGVAAGELRGGQAAHRRPPRHPRPSARAVTTVRQLSDEQKEIDRLFREGKPQAVERGLCCINPDDLETSSRPIMAR